jgi:hypothetical protein
MKKLILPIVTSLILLGAIGAQANQFCFASAKTYYEQIYCELEAKGKTKELPSFDQFKRNNEVVQASLLKLPAERNRITLPPPKRAKSSTENISIGNASDIETKEIGKKETVKKESAKALSGQQENFKDGYVARKFDKPVGVTANTNCQLNASEIRCSEKRYRLLGNKANKNLAQGALLDANKMALPMLQQDQSLNAYVTSAYRQYIEKMCTIGLGAVTMTYARFAYLYEDLQSKNVNFVNRFEIMYSYLKKDKAAMWISEKIPVNQQLAIQYCDLMTEKLYICATQGQNYIFELAEE